MGIDCKEFYDEWFEFKFWEFKKIETCDLPADICFTKKEKNVFCNDEHLWSMRLPISSKTFHDPWPEPKKSEDINGFDCVKENYPISSLTFIIVADVNVEVNSTCLVLLAKCLL